MNILNIGDWALVLFFLVGIFFFIKIIWLRKQDRNFPVPREKEKLRTSILIPARDESKVIEGILKSIEEQTRPVSMEDVYIIVETKEDPTVAIASSHHATILYRTQVERQRKGYALEEGVEQILKMGKQYDYYLIFDADNILKPDFIEQMDQTYLEGYDFATGYRKSKNGNINVIAACSTLIFSLLNHLFASSKKSGANCITYGSGLMITGEQMSSWKTFPFHTLAEDYEISLYAIAHQKTNTCNLNAQIYDEQPTDYQTTVKQRVRWIRGYLASRKIYAKQLQKQSKTASLNRGSQYGEGKGILPYLILVLGLIFYLLYNFVVGIFLFCKDNVLYRQALLRFGGTVLFIYLFLAVLTALLLHWEKEQINLKATMRWKAILFHPLFLVTYIPCLLKAMFKKEVTWDRIDHNSNLH